MENAKCFAKFEAVIAIGFSDKFAVLESSSTDVFAEKALEFVTEDSRDSGWLELLGIPTDVPCLLKVEAEVDINDKDPSYNLISQKNLNYSI